MVDTIENLPEPDLEDGSTFRGLVDDRVVCHSQHGRCDDGSFAGDSSKITLTCLEDTTCQQHTVVFFGQLEDMLLQLLLFLLLHVT